MRQRVECPLLILWCTQQTQLHGRSWFSVWYVLILALARSSCCGSARSTIADLVKHSGLPVIKSKEILQTLMKLELIHREHEKAVRRCTSGSMDGRGVH